MRNKKMLCGIAAAVAAQIAETPAVIRPGFRFALSIGVSDGIRTHDTQDHNLVL